MTRTRRPTDVPLSAIGRACDAGRRRAAPTIRTVARRSAATSRPPRSPPTTRRAPGAGSSVQLVDAAQSSALSRPSTVSRVPPDGRWYGEPAAVDRARRTPRRRGGADRPGPGGGRSGARRAGARPPAREGRRRGATSASELERRLEAGGRHVDADRHRVPAGLGVERRARGARPPRPGRSRRSARCPRSGPGRRGPSRRALAAALSTAPLRRRPVDADTSGPPGQVGDDERQPVGEPAAARPPGSRRPRRARLGPFGDDRTRSRRAIDVVPADLVVVAARPRRRRRRVVRRRPLGQVGQDHPVVGPEDVAGHVADRLGA